MSRLGPGYHTPYLRTCSVKLKLEFKEGRPCFYATYKQAYAYQGHIQNPRHVQNCFKYLRWSLLRKKLTAIIIFAISAFHVLHEFFQYRSNFYSRSLILCKSVWGPRGSGKMNFDIPNPYKICLMISPLLIKRLFKVQKAKVTQHQI